MQKKHSFSPNHKVVTDSKHNFHPQGNPSTASMGAPPQSIGGGGGEQPGGDSDGASMGGMNFCNGGMKYADGGVTAQSGPDAQPESGYDTGRGSVTPQTGPDAGTKRWKEPTGGIAKTVLPSGEAKTPMQIADDMS
jgi:hypothetical protein